MYNDHIHAKLAELLAAKPEHSAIPIVQRWLDRGGVDEYPYQDCDMLQRLVSALTCPWSR